LRLLEKSKNRWLERGFGIFQRGKEFDERFIF
jgi:hypothetical protein